MFSDELPTLRRSWSMDPVAVLLGTLTGIAIPALLVSPRLAIFFLPLIVVVLLLSRQSANGAHATPFQLDGLFVSFGAFVLYAFGRSLFEDQFAAVWTKLLLLAIVAAASVLSYRIVASGSRIRALHMGEGLWIGLAIGLTYYLFEAASNHLLKTWIINALHLSKSLMPQVKSFYWDSNGRLAGIGTADFTRGATPITLTLFPALMAALWGIVRPWNKRIAAALLFLAVTAVFFSPQESSKAAIVAGLAIFGLAWAARGWAARVVAGLWLLTCLAVMPAALLAHRLDLHEASWLPISARHRVVIWNYTAERAMEKPLFGIGPYMTYLKGSELSPEATEQHDGQFVKSLSRHAHNVYLQTWLELGAIGALLLAAAGLEIIRRIRKLTPELQPFAFATFCSAATLMASSYGMWQSWFMSLFALTPILFAAGQRIMETRGATASLDASGR